MRLFDTVRLKKDVPEAALFAGDEGEVIVLHDEVVEVKFFEEDRRVRAFFLIGHRDVEVV